MKIPFAPAVYEHAASLIGKTPGEVFRDPEAIYAGHRKAFLTYNHKPICVGIDIYNLEAEAYGATIANPGGTSIPAVAEPLVHSLDEALALPPYDPHRDGRIRMMIEVGQRLAKDLPEADVRIPVSGPFSIGTNLRGFTGMLEDVALYPRKVNAWLHQLAENQSEFCEAIVAAGLDIAFFESAATPPFLSPKQFQEIELPALKQILEIAAAKAGHPVPCVIGGNTAPIIEYMLSTGTGYVVCPCETNQRAFMAKMVDCPEVIVRINMTSNAVVRGVPEEMKAEIDEILDMASTRPNCLLGTGALPYETPPENVAWIAEYVA